MDEKRGSGERGARPRDRETREGVGLGASPSGYGEYVMGYALGTLHPPHTAAVDGGKPIEDEKEREFGCKSACKVRYVHLYAHVTHVSL